MIQARLVHLFALAALLAAAPARATRADDAPARLAPGEGDRVIVVGNALAERMQYTGRWETLLQSRFPRLNLVVRNLGWGGDALTRRMRSKDFQDHGHELADEKPDVLIAAYGFNESFAGPEGLDKFRADLAAFVREKTTTAYNGEAPPKLVLLSPIAHEDLGDPHLPDGTANNANLELYAKAMADVAREAGVLYVDLFAPTKALYAADDEPLTINGVHLNDHGDALVSALLDEALFGPRPAGAASGEGLAQLNEEVRAKNTLFFFDYRAVNGFYIYGGRKDPFGVVNFPAEFAKLRRMVESRDRRIWTVARGEPVSPTPDDSGTGKLVDVRTNVPNPAPILSPADQAATFVLPEGYEINLFASEVEFPDLMKPTQLAFDAKGRLWVTTMPSYPMYLPGDELPNDRILIYEDANKDGKADKQVVFADGLYLPGGMDLGDGGAYVAQQPNLMHLEDTDGDDHADRRELVLHGFDSADSHHAISAFVWGPGGGLYFQEGTFHQTSVETPYGPVYEHDAAVFRFEPRTWKFESYVSYPFANPWGHTFDRWGQDFVADASGGANYFAAAFSGQVDFPDKHGSLGQILKMQWRPTSGCELVSSRNFPEDTQGDYLLNNVIGFQGVLRYRMREDGSGFHADPVEPLLRSTDPNFRPVDLEFGPDGALYLVDWYNPLIGHMQHSVRDPNRDRTHGRIWRITYKGRPLVEMPKVAGAPPAELLGLLQTTPEDRTRYIIRRELRDREPAKVLEALDAWVAGLDTKDPEYWHNMLEALWVHQSLDDVDQDLLRRVLACEEPRARAAATRVLGYWRDRVDGPLELLRTLVGDEHPRVRLEAVRALSFFRGGDAAAAQEIAMESLLMPQDQYLEYTLNETNRTLDRRIREAGEGE